MRSLAGLVTALALLAVAARAEEQRVTVLTAHPAAQALASALASGAPIDVRPVQPEKLPASRLASFLAGRGAASLRDLAATADAVLTFRSFWPDDPLYPNARRANIRIVEIDAGRPLDGALPGIATLAPADDREVYSALDLSPMPASGEGAAPWLSPTALGRMADVVAADLERLAPQAKARVSSNLAEIKRRLITAKAKADAALADAPSTTALALSGRYAYLANDLGLELVASITAAPNEWTAQRAEKLAALIKSREVAVVLLDVEANVDVAAAIASAGAKALVVAQVGGGDDPVAVAENNLDRIAKAFAER
ncbi:zinc ABC transporter substrate-binding protein [Methylopila sp. M107]|uniref:metal ABC transporter solute-binding protein, Zn/Mn family n=1 Tax=Methylopila sp. M107 TaxID=1101190 RepID=UPI0003797C7B|nr:zinc ABC transporter substrate-binding protein [Methylopila sp. M107]